MEISVENIQFFPLLTQQWSTTGHRAPSTAHEHTGYSISHKLAWLGLSSLLQSHRCPSTLNELIKSISLLAKSHLGLLMKQYRVPLLLKPCLSNQCRNVNFPESSISKPSVFINHRITNGHWSNSTLND